jgi:hypothetical protein
MLITGKSERYGRKLLEKIRLKHQKEEHQFVTIKEFCSYTGLDITDVQSQLNA